MTEVANEVVNAGGQLLFVGPEQNTNPERWFALVDVSAVDLIDRALFYLRDTRLLGPNTPVSPGSVPMMISSSPLGAVNRPKDGPLVTVTVPVQSGLIV